MDFIDSKIEELQAERERVQKEIKEVAQPLQQRLVELDLVLEKIAPYSTQKTAKKTVKREAKKARSSRKKRKKSRSYQEEILRLLEEGPWDHAELIQKLGGGTSVYRALKRLQEKDLVQRNNNALSLVKQKQARAA